MSINPRVDMIGQHSARGTSARLDCAEPVLRAIFEAVVPSSAVVVYLCDIHRAASIVLSTPQPSSKDDESNFSFDFSN